MRTETIEIPKLIRPGHIVYFLWDWGELVYIGKTNKWLSRIFSHVESGKEFDCATYVECDGPEHADNVETYMIRMCSTRYNSRVSARYAAEEAMKPKTMDEVLEMCESVSKTKDEFRRLRN